jgi:sortase A
MIKRYIAILLIGVSALSFGQALWISVKAELAQVLIKNAWQDSIDSQTIEKPWTWADTWPVGRLMHPNSETDLYILEGAQGNALAFGPGRHSDSALLGNGSTVIGGHKDTHFAFLKHVELGDMMQLQLLDGRWLPYRVVDKQVYDSSKGPLPVATKGFNVYLVTCYPFDSLDSFSSGGPLRLVITLSLS